MKKLGNFPLNSFQGSISSTILCVRFSYESVSSNFSLVTFWQKSTFVQKRVHKMLMKLTQGVNFINILCEAFTHTDTKRTKQTDNWIEFLRFLDQLNMLVKSTPDF